MNRIYRIIFNRTLGQYRVASEHARGQGKRKALVRASPGRLTLQAGVAALALMAAVHPAFAETINNGAHEIVDGSHPSSGTKPSPWVTGALDIGGGSEGALTIRNGGIVTTDGPSTIGYVDGTGTVTVTGEGSSLSIGQALHVGQFGNGNLLVQDGGIVSAQSYVSLGVNAADAIGTAMVTGAGSTLSAAGHLTLGHLGTAMLTIADEGMVSASEVFMGGVPGTGHAGSGMLNLFGTDSARGVLETGQISKGLGSANVSFNGGTLRATAAQTDFFKNFNAGDITFDVGGAFIDTNGHDIGIAAPLAGVGGLTKLGHGTLTLSGANTYAGATTVEAGILRADRYGAFVNNGAYVINGGTLDLSNYKNPDTGIDLSMSSLSGSGGMLNMGGTYIRVDQAADTIYEGDITAPSGRLYKRGTGSLVLNGQISSLNHGLYAEGGTLVLNGVNTYAGYTVLGNAVLEAGHNQALSTGAVLLRGTNATLRSNTTVTLANDLLFDGAISSLTIEGGHDLTLTGAIGATNPLSNAGTLLKAGAGTLTLAGNNRYDGATVVDAGTLIVEGSIARSSQLTINPGATLGGSGTVGDTAVADGGVLAPGNGGIGTLTVAGDLRLSSGSILDYELGRSGTAGTPAAGVSDRIDVTGDLTLDGTLNLSQSGDPADGAAGPGYYRLITYSGSLSGNGLALGAVPALPDAGYEIQSGNQRVDLFVGAIGDDTLQHWQGGDGAWNATSAQWLNKDGNAAVAWAGNHAVFKNQPGGFDGGTISVEGSQRFAGLQFVDEGYRLEGGGKLETGADGSEIRVLANRAEIAAGITGSGGIVKTQAGTLVLSGDNSYRGGTVIEGGKILAGSSQAIRGGYAIGAQGVLDLDRHTATITSLSGDGSVLFGPTGMPSLTIDQAQDGTFAGSFDLRNYFSTSFGSLTKQGAGTLHLTGDSDLSSWGNAGSFSLEVLGGTLSIEQGGSLRYGGQTTIGGADGKLRIHGGDTRWHSGLLAVGTDGTGELVIDEHAQARTSTAAFIGHGSDGEASVSNGAHWEQSGTLVVGRAAGVAGRLKIETGGSMATGGMTHIGQVPDGSGAVVVSNGQWTTARNLFVGDGGQGSLTIRDAGLVTVGAGNTREHGLIGYEEHAAGRVSVDGAGSRWSMAKLNVGHQGRGTLDVTNGGAVVSRETSVGAAAGSQGAVAIHGGGSTWTTWGLTIGQNGEGRVSLTEGGTLDTGFSGIVLAEQAGSSGSLHIGEGADAGSLATSGITFGMGDGALVFDHASANYRFTARLTSGNPGGGRILHRAGVTTLDANNASFDGLTHVTGGTLIVDNTLGGSVRVEDHARLGGSGSIGSGAASSVIVSDGGTLAPGRSIGTLAVNGKLILANAARLDYELGKSGAGDALLGISDRITVNGDLVLNGTLNLSQSDSAADGTLGPGYYRLITYSGSLSGNGLAFGSVPALPGADYEVQSGNQRIDLFVGAIGDDTLQHWQGGDGTWNAASTQWRNADGEMPTAWAGNHAVFKNQPGGFDGGTISVEGSQRFAGLQFVDEGYRLEGGGKLETGADGSEIRVLADRAEIAAEISGSGGIVKTQAGTLVLSGHNSYEGGTQILNGEVSIASDGNLGAATGEVLLNGGTLATTAGMTTGRAITLAGRGGFDVAAGTTLAATGTISGPGSLIKTGSGTLHLTGTNRYGDTMVREGGLIGDAASISGNIVNDGEVAFYQQTDGTFAGAISGSGLMRKVGFGMLTLEGRNTLDWALEAGHLNSSGVRFSGDVAIGTDGRFVLDDIQAASYAGTISGTGQFHKQGTGTLLLTGDSAGFAGRSTVKAGTLLVGDHDGNGALGGSLDVLAGATLGGSGTVGSGAGSRATVASGGVLAPGNSIGTLTVNGDLVFENGSRFEVEVDPQGKDSDQVRVTGDTGIHGGSVAHLGATGQYDLRSTYTLLTTGGALSGKFDTVTSDFAFLTPALHYDYEAGKIGLELTRNDRRFAALALTKNQSATADGIESIGLAAGHAVYDAIAQLPDDAARVRASLDALSGEIHASAKTALIEDSRFVRDAATDRMRAAFAAPGAFRAPVSARGADGAAQPVSASHDGPVVWSQAFGSWGSTDSDDNAASLDRKVGGMLIGADQALGSWRVGALAGYSHSDFKAFGRASSGRSDNYHLSMYGGTQRGALGLRTGLAYSWHDMRTRRSVAVPGLHDSLRADYGGGTFQAFGELGYGIDLNTTTRLEPFASLSHVRLHTDGYGENGDAAALSANSANTESTFSTLGVRAEHALSIGAVEGTVRAMAGWRHATGDVTPRAQHAFSAGNAFTVAGVPVAKDSAVVDLGVDLAVTRNTRFGLSYAGRISDSARDHGIKANLQIRF